MVSIRVTSADERRPFFVERRRAGLVKRSPRKGKAADEAYVSAEQPTAKAHSRFSLPHGNTWGAEHPQAPPPEGPQEPDRAGTREACPAIVKCVRAPRRDRPRALLRSAPNQERRFTFGKDVRIRRRRDFLTIQAKGWKTHSRNFVVVSMAHSPACPSRFGFSVSRRVGNAVVRNRVKRRLREFCRLHRSRFDAGRDFVVIAKPGAATLSYAEIVEELRGALS